MKPPPWHDLEKIATDSHGVSSTWFDMADGPNNEKALSILVAHDFPAWRVRLRSILQARSKWRVICEACDGLQAVQRTIELRPDIVLLDIQMPVLSGIEAAKLISKLSPGSRIVFVTQYDDSVFRNAALATGAELYLLKSHVASELVPSVESLSTTLNPVQLK